MEQKYSRAEGNEAKGAFNSFEEDNVTEATEVDFIS